MKAFYELYDLEEDVAGNFQSDVLTENTMR